MIRALVLVLAVAAVGVLAGGCGANHTAEDFRVAITSVNGVSGFSLGTITVTQGNDVNLHVDNTTDKQHGFSIDAFNVHDVVDAHKSVNVSFKANKTGQFTVYCQLHPAHVPGRIIVVG